jgi:molecular chaperone DnaJ
MTSDYNLYEVLEVSPSARDSVIKAAYRCLVQHYHPDRNSGDDKSGDRLAKINHAYAVLSDHDGRHAYDKQLGLHTPCVERRGGPATMAGGRGRVRTSGRETRPFGFRPLD